MVPEVAGQAGSVTGSRIRPRLAQASWSGVTIAGCECTKGGEHAAFSAEKVLASHGNPGSLRSIDWIESDSHEPVVCDELEIIV